MTTIVSTERGHSSGHSHPHVFGAVENGNVIKVCKKIKSMHSPLIGLLAVFKGWLFSRVVEIHKNIQTSLPNWQTDSFKETDFVFSGIFSFWNTMKIFLAASQGEQRKGEFLQREKSFFTQRLELLICMLEAKWKSIANWTGFLLLICQS